VVEDFMPAGSAVVAAKAQAFVDVDVDVDEAEAEAEVVEREDTIQLRRWSRWIRCSSRVRLYVEAATRVSRL
jgi:hypothetical protein